MNDPLYPPVSDHIERALEAVCATLITLEVIRTSMPEDARVKLHILHAINSSRRAIAELRTAGAPGVREMLPRGFVLADGDLSEPPSAHARR